MPEETRKQHLARLRELNSIGKQRKLTSPELWEVSRRCDEVGDLTKSRQAAEQAKALDDLEVQARHGEGGGRPEPPVRAVSRQDSLPPVTRVIHQRQDSLPPVTRVIHQGPTTWDIANGTCCGIIMVPFAIVAFLALGLVLLGLLSSVSGDK